MKTNYYEDAAREFEQAFEKHVRENQTLRHTLVETIASWMFRYHDMLRTRDDLCSRNQQIQDENEKLRFENSILTGDINSLRASQRNGRITTREELRAEIAELAKPCKPQPFEFWIQDRIDELSRSINDHTASREYGEHLSVWANELASLQCKLNNLTEEENA